MKKTKIKAIVDIYFIVLLAVLLILSNLFGLDKFLFKFPYITLLAFYFIGKFARNYELKHYL